jgi:hypothetical protein
MDKAFVAQRTQEKLIATESAIDLALKLAPEPQAADRAAPAPASDTAPGMRAAPAAR